MGFIRRPGVFVGEDGQDIVDVHKQQYMNQIKQNKEKTTTG